jgi:hypothetical protein
MLCRRRILAASRFRFGEWVRRSESRPVRRSESDPPGGSAILPDGPSPGRRVLCVDGGASFHRPSARATLVAVGQEIEEQFATGAIEGGEAQFVDDEHVDLEQATLQPSQLAGVARLKEQAHEIRRASEEDASFELNGFGPERDGEVGLPRTDRARKDQILGAVEPFPASQGIDLGGADALGRVEVST